MQIQTTPVSEYLNLDDDSVHLGIVGHLQHTDLTADFDFDIHHSDI